MDLKIAPDTKFAILVKDGDVVNISYFEEDDANRFDVRYKLTEPVPVPETYTVHDSQMNPGTVYFVALDYSGVGHGGDMPDAILMVTMEVVNEMNDPAIEFVREHAIGGYMEDYAHHLYLECFAKAMDGEREKMN
jgi:hypothetical protein